MLAISKSLLQYMTALALNVLILPVPNPQVREGNGTPLHDSFLILFLLYFTLQYCIGFAIH